MARKRYNVAAIDRRRAAVAAYRLRGYSVRQIVDALPNGLPNKVELDKASGEKKILSWHIESVKNPNTGQGYGIGTIDRDLQELKAEWKAAAETDFGQLKADHLASIRYGIQQAWAQNKLYYVFRGLELEAAVLGLHEPDMGEDIAAKMGAFLAGVDAATSGDVPDLSEAPGSTSGVPDGLSDEPGPNGANGHPNGYSH